MAKKKSDGTQALTVYFSVAQHDKLRLAAFNQRRHMSEIVRQLVDDMPDTEPGQNNPARVTPQG